jgi:hypothetical protein
MISCKSFSELRCSRASSRPGDRRKAGRYVAFGSRTSCRSNRRHRPHDAQHPLSLTRRSTMLLRIRSSVRRRAHGGGEEFRRCFVQKGGMNRVLVCHRADGRRAGAARRLRARKTTETRRSKVSRQLVTSCRVMRPGWSYMTKEQGPTAALWREWQSKSIRCASIGWSVVMPDGVTFASGRHVSR